MPCTFACAEKLFLHLGRALFLIAFTSRQRPFLTCVTPDAPLLLLRVAASVFYKGRQSRREV